MMRLLLDTHILIWALADAPKMSQQARNLISDGGNDICFSAASIWEIAIEARLGRVSFTFEPDMILSAARSTGLTELPIDARAALLLSDLPDHHHDPFDRLLVAQAIDVGVELLTSNAALSTYSPLVRRV